MPAAVEAFKAATVVLAPTAGVAAGVVVEDDSLDAAVVAPAAVAGSFASDAAFGLAACCARFRSHGSTSYTSDTHSVAAATGASNLSESNDRNPDACFVLRQTSLRGR